MIIAPSHFELTATEKPRKVERGVDCAVVTAGMNFGAEKCRPANFPCNWIKQSARTRRHSRGGGEGGAEIGGKKGRSETWLVTGPLPCCYDLLHHDLSNNEAPILRAPFPLLGFVLLLFYAFPNCIVSDRLSHELWITPFTYRPREYVNKKRFLPTAGYVRKWETFRFIQLMNSWTDRGSQNCEEKRERSPITTPLRLV